jgi:hypothetical protein
MRKESGAVGARRSSVNEVDMEIGMSGASSDDQRIANMPLYNTAKGMMSMRS